MNIHEHQAKKILKKYGATVPEGVFSFDVKDLIERNGGSVKSSVSKKTSYLLAGENPGSKIKKANDIGVSIINEEELSDLIKNG